MNALSDTELAGVRKQEDMDHFARLFTDQDYFNSVSDNDQIRQAQKLNPFGDIRKRAANKAFLETESGKPLTGIEYDLTRDGYAKAQLNAQHPVSDEQFFGLLKTKFEGEKARSLGDQDLLGDVALSAWDDMTTGQQRTTAEFVQKYKAENPDYFKGLDGQGEVDAVSSLSAASQDLRDRFQKYSAPAKLLFDAVTKQTGQSDSKDAPEIGSAIAQFGVMSPDDRQVIYAATLLAAKRKGFEPKDFLMQVGESLGRGSLGAANQAVRVAYEDRLRARKEFITSGVDETQPGLLKPMTDEEKAAELRDIEEKLNTIKIVREVNALAEATDPIKLVTKSWLGQVAEKSAYGAASSVGYLAASAVPVIGPVLTFQAIKAGEYERMMNESPNLSPEAASQFATISAIPQALMDRLQLEILFPKVPAFAEMLRSMAVSKRGAVGIAANFGKRLAATTGFETAIELPQNFIPIAVDQLGAALNKDYKSHDFQSDFKDWAEAAPETLGSRIILSMIGAGVATHSDVKNGRFLTSVVKPLRMAGLSEEQAARIVAEKTPKARDAKLQEEWSKRTPENIKEGVKIANAEAEKVRASQESPARPTLESTVSDDGSRVFTVRAADGKVILSTSDSEAAQVAICDENAAIFTRQTSGINEALTHISAVNEAIGRGEDVQKMLVTDAPRTLLAEYEANPTPDNLDRLFETVRFHGDEISDKSQLAGYFVKASNRGAIKEGIYRSIIRIHEGADGTHVMRDFAQDNLKRAIGEGDVTIEWVRGQLESLKGNKEYSGMRTETDTDVIESFSDVALAYATGRTKEAQIPAGLRGFLRQMAVFFRDMAGRVYRLKRAIAEGKVGDNFQRLLATSVGLDTEQIVAMEEEKAQRRMERELLDSLNGGDFAQGDELLTVLKSAKLPDSGSQFWNEDFARIKEAVQEHNKGKSAKEKIKLSDIFSDNAIDPDLNVVGALQENGFDFFTVDDLVQAVEARITSGKPQFGTMSNDALQGANYSIGKKGTPAIADRGSIVNQRPSSDSNSESFSFQSAPDFSGDEVKLPQWQAARQPEILSEQVKGAKKAVELAKNRHIEAAQVLNIIRIGGFPIGGGSVGDFARDWITMESNGARDGYGKPYVPRSRIESELLPQIEKMIKSASDALIKAEADLFLAIEEEGGRADTLAAKESAAEWARRTKAAEFAALLDARDEKAKNAAKSFISDVWAAFGQHDEVFQYGRTDSKDAADIAEAVSSPGKPVTVSYRGEQVTFIGKEGSLTIHEADTGRPYIRSTEANSQGKEDGGGSQLYAAALDWIHNNGKRIKDDRGLTSINATRRTSNFLASAIRWGTTKHLKPHVGQKVKWTKSDILNTAALAAKEMENAFKAIPDVRGWEYDFRSGQFRDDAGNDLARERLAAAVQLGNPKESGIGLATLQRAIITQSAIRAFERGETSESVLDAAGRGVVPIGVTYSIGRAGENRVNAALEAQLKRSPDARLAMYERAKALFNEVRARRGTSEDPNKKFSSLHQSMGELDAILKVLPAEIRGKVGGWMPLANMAKDTKSGNREATVDKFLEKRIEMVGKALEKTLRAEYGAKMERLLERARPAKDEAGKRKQGKLGADVHALFVTAKQAMEWTPEEAQSKMDLLQSEIDTGELDSKDEAHKLQEIGAIRLVHDWGNADAERRSAAVGSLTDTLTKGYLAFQIKKSAERDAQKELARRFVKSSGYIGDSSQIDERDALAAKNAGFVGRITDTVRRFVRGGLSFDHAMRWHFGDENADALAMIDGQRESENKKSDLNYAVFDKVESLYSELAGGKLKGAKLQWDMSVKSIEASNAHGESKRLLSPMEAIGVTLMWRQGDGQRHMLGKLDDNGNPVGEWHYDQKFVDEVESKLSPEAKRVRDFLAEEYGREWDEINPVYREVFGVDMPRHENYSPLDVDPLREAANAMADPTTGLISSVSTTPGSFRTRGTSIAEPKFHDALATFIAHKMQMNHWIAYAQFITDARAVLGGRDVRRAVSAITGDRVLSEWLNIIQAGGSRDAAGHLQITKSLEGALSRAATMALVGKISVVAIQSTQLASAAAEMPFMDYASRMSALLTGNLGWGEAISSPYIQRRIREQPVIVQQAFRGLSVTRPNELKYSVQKLGSIINGADALFTAGTYAIVYDYRLKKALESGMNEASAKEFARNEAERITDTLAQPTRQGARSLMENSMVGPAWKTGWAFGSEPRKNLALLAYSFAKRDAATKLRTAAMLFVGYSVLGTLIRSAWRDLKDGGDEELFDKKFWQPSRLAVTVATDHLNGIPFIGEGISESIKKASGQYSQSGDLLSGFSAGFASARHIPEIVSGDRGFEQSMKDFRVMLASVGYLNTEAAAATSLAQMAIDLYGTGENAAKLANPSK